jgi:hypothetical protein
MSDQVSGFEKLHIDSRKIEALNDSLRMELDEKLVFKPNSKVDLGLKDSNREILHRGDVSRKSDRGFEWLDIHLILLDNFFIMSKRRLSDRGQERLEVSKPVLNPLMLHLISANPTRTITVRGTDRIRCPQKRRHRNKDDRRPPGFRHCKINHKPSLPLHRDASRFQRPYIHPLLR